MCFVLYFVASLSWLLHLRLRTRFSERTFYSFYSISNVKTEKKNIQHCAVTNISWTRGTVSNKLVHLDFHFEFYPLNKNYTQTNEQSKQTNRKLGKINAKSKIYKIINKNDFSFPSKVKKKCYWFEREQKHWLAFDQKFKEKVIQVSFVWE